MHACVSNYSQLTKWPQGIQMCKTYVKGKNPKAADVIANLVLNVHGLHAEINAHSRQEAIVSTDNQHKTRRLVRSPSWRAASISITHTACTLKTITAAADGRTVLQFGRFLWIQLKMPTYREVAEVEGEYQINRRIIATIEKRSLLCCIFSQCLLSAKYH